MQHRHTSERNVCQTQVAHILETQVAILIKSAEERAEEARNQIQAESDRRISEIEVPLR